MAKTLGKSWIDEGFERGEKRGIKLGEKRGEKRGEERGIKLGELVATRKYLRGLLEARFGPSPEAWAERIESATNTSKLAAALHKVSQIGSVMRH